MTWESLGSVSTGQMPDDEPWILFCHDFARKYLILICGSPPDHCELGTYWQGSYPYFGLYREYSTWDSDQYLSDCENALEKFNSAIDWHAIKPEFDEDKDVENDD